MSSEKIFTPVGAINSKHTYSPAVRVGNLVWISGMTAVNPERRIVGVGDIAEQARYIYRKMEDLLKELGGSLHNIVETIDYVTTFEGYERTAEVRREVFGPQPFPAATGVLVAGLIRAEALIEIRATAVLGSSGQNV